MKITPLQQEMLDKESAFEKEGKFHDHVQPINWDVVLPVTPEYNFLPKTLGFTLWSAFIRMVVNTFAPVIDWFACGTTVRGRENLKGIRRAVVTCNHVHDLDNMMVRQAIRGWRHSLYITVADFNSRKDLIGHIMRGGGTLPFSQSITAMRNLNKAVQTVLSKDRYLLCFPEGTLWWRYEKVRPFLDGAFHYASESSVPVIPTFITFKKAGPIRRLFSKKKVAVIHIMPAIYPKKEFTKKQNIAYLRDRAFEETKECYEAFYGKPLEYNGEPVLVDE